MDVSDEWLLSGSDDSSIISWNKSTAQLIQTFKGYRKGLTSIVSWNNFMISAGSDGSIKFWNIQMNALDASYSCYDHGTVVNCLLLHEGDLFSGAADGRIIQWDLNSNTVKAQFDSHTDSVLSMVGRFNYLYTTGSDCVVKRWTISDKEATHTSSSKYF
jgi:WD40 repeat protein